MNAGKPHQIRIEQCEAAQTIRERYGLEAAFDYAVGEKLMKDDGTTQMSVYPALLRSARSFWPTCMAFLTIGGLIICAVVHVRPLLIAPWPTDEAPPVEPVVGVAVVAA